MNWNKFLPCILLTTVLGACSGKGEQPNVEPTALCLTDSLLRIVSVDTVHVQEVIDELTLNGRVTFNENQVAHVYPMFGEVWLDEKHYLERSDYKSGTVISHGFTDEKVIQDYPLRGKPVYLHVRRRRWYDKATGETFSYTYDDLTAEGTKLTPEFVAFLKEED